MKNYQPFKHFALRSPLLPFTFLKELLSTENISETALKKVCNKKEIQEAIFLASPNLYSKIEKWLKGKLKDKKETERLQYSIYKYLARMTSRSTPFGLFAGISTGKIADKTNLEVPLLNEYRRVTRMDMNYLCALIRDLSKNQEIQNKLKYFPNTSIYKIADYLRYVEYTYIKSKRNHHIVSVDNSDYLQSVLSAAKNGAYVNKLAHILVDDDISFTDAREFISELIDSQILVSELEPGVTGNDLLETLLNTLGKLKNTGQANNILLKVKKKLITIDKKPPGINIDIYSKIADSLKNLNTSFDTKFLFQTDMIKPAPNLSISKKITDRIKEGVLVLKKLSVYPAETNLNKFKEAFYKRYEDKEVPLLIALDTETGIGYLQNSIHGDVSPLIDDIILPQRKNSSYKIEWHTTYSFLLKKYLQAIKNNKYEIEITEEEIKNLQKTNKQDNLPVSISAMVQIFKYQDSERIFMSSAGGSSAANLLGRFCHTDKTLFDYVKSITKKEAEYYRDKIIAEIVHLPESRTGNILHRPVLRDYEIPYLAKSAVEEKFQILPDDLMISVKRDEIILRSKKRNKEIIPRLSTAHNYSFNALPVYHFLCDMQTQSIMGGVGFSWGPLSNEYPFLPRVIYKNIIFSLASWNISKKDFEKIVKINNDKQLLIEIKKWRKERNMPEWVALEDGDNELTINLDNILALKTLISLVKNRQGFKLTEFLFNETNLMAKNKEGAFTNEFIFSFYNQK